MAFLVCKQLPWTSHVYNIQPSLQTCLNIHVQLLYTQQYWLIIYNLLACLHHQLLSAGHTIVTSLQCDNSCLSTNLPTQSGKSKYILKPGLNTFDWLTRHFVTVIKCSNKCNAGMNLIGLNDILNIFNSNLICQNSDEITVKVIFKSYHINKIFYSKYTKLIKSAFPIFTFFYNYIYLYILYLNQQDFVNDTIYLTTSGFSGGYISNCFHDVY